MPLTKGLCFTLKRIMSRKNKHINPYTNLFERDKLAAEVNNELQDYDLLKLGTFYNENIEVNNPINLFSGKSKNSW